MKSKIIAIVCILLIGAVVVAQQPETEQDIVRIHIRADGDSAEDQRIKYAVKDAVVQYLTPILSTCDSMEKLRLAVRQNMDEVVAVANCVLCQNAANYRASASFGLERFPARSYDGKTYCEGIYESLIITLGTGKGQNWWCVLYPPLCFVPEGDGADTVVYKSKILEIINSYFGGK